MSCKLLECGFDVSCSKSPRNASHISLFKSLLHKVVLNGARIHADHCTFFEFFAWTSSQNTQICVSEDKLGPKTWGGGCVIFFWVPTAIFAMEWSAGIHITSLPSKKWGFDDDNSVFWPPQLVSFGASSGADEGKERVKFNIIVEVRMSTPQCCFCRLIWM